MQCNQKPMIGIYEKALPSWLSWEELLESASKAGYDFIEISIDESDERLSRLDWDREKRIELKNAINSTGVPIFSMCLSAHRKFPIGSGNEQIRNRGMEIMEKAIVFAHDVGIRVIQLAAYDVFYNEVSSEKTRELFLKNLQKSVEWAGLYGVTLALETMDTEFADSVAKLIKFVRIINSPWLQVYPDVGNLSAVCQDVTVELLRAEGHMVAIHLKDTEIGKFRRIPFGKGTVPFVDIFRLLRKIDYKGPFLIEMWTDDDKDSINIIKNAREWIMGKWDLACKTDSSMEEAI